MKVIESKETEAKEFFKKVTDMQYNEEIVDYICIPIYKDGSFDYFHTTMRSSAMIATLEMAKHVLLNEWNE